MCEGVTALSQFTEVFFEFGGNFVEEATGLVFDLHFDCCSYDLCVNQVYDKLIM